MFGARTADNKASLWIRSLSSPSTARMLAGTEGATFPFWSPDNRSVAFFAGGKLKTIDITGGPAIAIADASGARGGSWSPEGVIVFTPEADGPLHKIAASGGPSSPATSVKNAEVHRFPWFLPDGRHFLFEEQLTRGSVEVVLRIGSLDSLQTVEIGHASSNAVYSSGHLLFLGGATLMAQPFDPDTRTVQGEAVPLPEQVSWVLNDGRKGVFTVSSSGLLAYQAGGDAGQQRLSWFDRAGKVVSALSESGNLPALELSPDGKSAAVVSVDAKGNQEIWIHDLLRNLRRRFTVDPAQDRQPVWSPPDGRALVWTSSGGKRTLRRKSADGNGTEEVLYEDANLTDVTSWSSPDGKFLLINKVSSGTGMGIWILPITPEKPGSPRKPTVFLDTPFSEGRGVFSPDGAWVAYVSNESQQNEIYVTPFQGPGVRHQISTTGGNFPRWRRKEIFYAGLDGKLMAAEVTLKASSIDVGQVKPLGITVPTVRGIPYDVSLDGQSILAITELERTRSIPLTLVQNWTSLLKK